MFHAVDTKTTGVVQDQSLLHVIGYFGKTRLSSTLTNKGTTCVMKASVYIYLIGIGKTMLTVL